MKQPSFFKKIGTHLLGLVDEYWAIRRPWHYGNRNPECKLEFEEDRYRSDDAV
ncbi:hypothetical protein [Synechococcus sp. M16CYN]|uniref:hypothetical protein n=1 Tax=Synechococcus sp. M16CYN TaxID=3103139 RepID=UPI0033404A9F